MAGLWISAADTVDPTGEATEWAIHYASWILYKLSGEKYTGVHTTTDNYSLDVNGSFVYRPQVVSGQVYNMSATYNNIGATQIPLRRTPVRSIVAVSVGGKFLPPDSYELRNNRYIVRKDKLPWILDKYMEVTVTYVHGSPPPMAGKLAAIRLANEFIWSETDYSKCSLPERVTSVSRQNMSYTILDPQEFLENGKTGVYQVDLFLAAANPDKARKKSKVFSPDKPRGERIN